MEGDGLGSWDPLEVQDARALLSNVRAHWWIAGGQAIDLAIGRELRKHSDLDVLVLRKDHTLIRDAFSGWELWVADPPGSLRPWKEGELLPAELHDVWCRPGPTEPWRLQIMVDESDGDDWVSRRDARIRRPIETIGAFSDDVVPYLVPEIQLYYKAKEPRGKDEIDFAATLPGLSSEQRDWLAFSIRVSYGAGHPWLGSLGPRGEGSPAR